MSYLEGGIMEIGDIVVTKNSGVCRIVAREEKNFGIGPKPYLILKPYFAKDTDQTKIYIPADNDSLIRPLMKKEEILKVIDAMPSLEKIWYSDQKVRKMKFEEIYKSGDIYQICQMIKSLYLHNEELKLTKHTLSMLDREYLNKLRDGIYQEFAVALGISCQEVDEYIAERIG